MASQKEHFASLKDVSTSVVTPSAPEDQWDRLVPPSKGAPSSYEMEQYPRNDNEYAKGEFSTPLCECCNYGGGDCEVHASSFLSLYGRQEQIMTGKPFCTPAYVTYLVGTTCGIFPCSLMSALLCPTALAALVVSTFPLAGFACGLWQFYVPQRKRMLKAFNLRSPCDDFWLLFFCLHCTAAQQMRELKIRGIHHFGHFTGNVPATLVLSCWRCFAAVAVLVVTIKTYRQPQRGW